MEPKSLEDEIIDALCCSSKLGCFVEDAVDVSSFSESLREILKRRGLA